MQRKLFEAPLNPDITAADLPETLQEVAEIIGFDNTLALVERFGGEYIFICTAKRMKLPARNRKIYNEFDGANHGALARKYSLTVSHVREIIKEERGKAGR